MWPTMSRHRLKKPDILNLWTTIISKAALVPNPRKRNERWDLFDMEWPNQACQPTGASARG